MRAQRSVDLRDEIASALTHGLGAAAALGRRRGADHPGRDLWRRLATGAAIVFGVALLLLYLASTLYHAIQHPIAKGRLKVFDHCAIYLLIAGTYTPFTLIGLRGRGAGACSPRSGRWRSAGWCSSCSTPAASSACPR
jgi:hemolysin III